MIAVSNFEVPVFCKKNFSGKFLAAFLFGIFFCNFFERPEIFPGRIIHRIFFFVNFIVELVFDPTWNI